MQKFKLKERLQGAIIGAVIAVAVMIAVPAFARVAQETITVNFNNIRVAVDGQLVQTEYEPFIFQGRTYLPTRDIANAAGFNVTWEDATNTVHLTSRANPNVVPNYPPHQPTQTPQPTSSPSVSEHGNRPSNPAISLERAIEIAEADLVSRGINATYRSNSGMSWERGQWVWELLFRTQGERMPLIEFYINVDNGNIVKFEWDD
jgi:uncharacterized membrane protein YkoI